MIIIVTLSKFLKKQHANLTDQRPLIDYRCRILDKFENYEKS